MLFYKSYKFLFFIATIIVQISTQEYEIGEQNCKIIYIQQKLIYIYNSETNTDINEYSSSISKIGSHSESIKTYKDILKINDNKFIIIGATVNNFFIYQICSLSDDGILTINSHHATSHQFEIIRQLEGRLITENILILYSIQYTESSNFFVYKIDISSNNNNIEPIRIPTNLNGVTYHSYDTKKNIQCDALNEDYYFCIFTITYEQGEDSFYKMLYFRGEFKSGGSIINSGYICEKGCYLGNIAKISDEYLVCYHLEESVISIICQYYSFDSNNNIILGKTKEIGNVGMKKNSERALILKVYSYSIFTISDFDTSGIRLSLLIESSLDLNINIKSYPSSGAYRFIDYFNDDIISYYFFEKEEGGIISTYLGKKSLYNCDINYLVISNEDVQHNFYSGHTNQKIGFSLNENIKLYKGNEAISMTSNNFITLDNTNFIFKKPNNAGVFYNYYAYTIISKDEIYSTYSLICPLKVVKCPDSCKSCDHNKDVSPTNHFCTECNSGYFPISEESDGKDSYNCYLAGDDNIGEYYYDNGKYYHCDNSCKSCTNSNSCSECKEGYYFMANNENEINTNDICYNPTTLKEPSYYLSYVNNQFVYKHCYETCLECTSGGDEKSNNCVSCKSGYIKYNFNEYQCTVNTEDCIKKKNYWTFNNNNIQCISQCDNYIVLFGENRGQCVENCENFVNPYSISSSNNLYSLICGGQKYCISYDVCNNGYFVIDYEIKTCDKVGECKVDFFNNINTLYDPPPTQDISTEELSIEEKKNEIKNRLKIMKVLTNSDNYHVKNNYEIFLIRDYYQLLKSEASKYTDNKIYLTTSIQYNNFTITIYPLDIEDYTYEKIFFPNDLGFVNFTNYYSDFLNYEIENRRIILAGILEYQATNTSIKDLNYFLYSFNEKSNNSYNLGNLLNLNDLINNNSELEVQYPLFNYINNNSFVNKRNTEFLVDNIKDMYERYPEVELSNLSDPFYIDICFLFTSDEGTDMTLNDRRNEYYVNISLCEENCTLIRVINKDSTPRALCSCDAKSNIIFDMKKGMNDTIEPYSVENSRSFICISESFNHSISKNGIFWIFIIIIILQIYLLIIYIKYKDTIIAKILGLNNNNHENNNNEILSSSDDSKFIYDYKKNDLEKNIDNISNDKVDSQQEEVLSAPINKSNPPKKRIDYRRPNSSTTKTDIREEKDLISGNDSSIIKESTIKFNDKNQNDFTDISFDDLQNGYEFFKIDNLFSQKDIMLRDNYLKNPLLLERLKKMKKIKKALRPLNQKELIKYYNTCEDIFYPNQKNNKFINKKNKKITKILGGQEIFAKNLFDNYSDNENKPRYPKFKNNLMFEDEGIFTGDQIIFSGKNLEPNHNDLIEEEPSLNNLKMKKNKNKNNLLNSEKKNTLARSLGRKEINKLKEDEKNNEERLKTEIDIDASNKIKTELMKLGKGSNRPNSSLGIFGKNVKKNNNNSSIESDFKKLLKTNKVQSLKLIDKSENKNEIKNSKEISKGTDSKRMMIRFQEEGEMYGDMGAQNLEEEKLKQKRNKNLEILQEKNLFTSTTELLETENREILIEENFILYFWKYFMKRELWITCIKDKKETVPYFIRYSSLGFCVSFIFLLNCFLFLESDVHRRYLNALSGRKNGLGYYFRKEFGTTICVSLLSNLFKIIIIKLVIIKLFKIGKKPKRLMKASTEKGLNPNELEELQLKRQKYLNDYKRNLLIYFVCLMCLNAFIAYICICYGGVFPNSIGAFLFGLLFSLIFSFIFCAVICLIIVSLYRLGKYLNNKCLLSAYIVLSTLY